MALKGIKRAKEWANRLWEPGDTLSQRTVRSGFWIFALSSTNRLFRLIRTLILARVLAPNDFGLMAIALLAMLALRTLSQTGFQTALIQKRGSTVDFLDTAWIVSALRGIVLFSILYSTAPYIALFFNNAVTIPIIRVVGISMLLNGLTNIGVIYFQKELEFSKQFIYQLSGSVADLIVAITAALVLRSVWALVFGHFAGHLAQFWVSYVIHPYRPRGRLNAKKARELYRFGRWILGSSVIVFVILYGDDIFLGRVLGATALGLYQVASRFSNILTAEFAHAIGKLVFPVYSKLQDNTPKLRESFLTTVELTAFVLLPLINSVFLLAPDAVRVFLGDKWMPMVPPMRILAISGLVLSIQATGGWLFQAVGQPKLDFWMNLVRVIVMAIIIYPLTSVLGMTGTAATVLCGTLATMPIWWYSSCAIIKSNYAGLLKRLWPSLAATGLMGLGILATRYTVAPVGIAGLIAAALIGIAIYASFALFLWRQFQYGPIGSLQILRRLL